MQLNIPRTALPVPDAVIDRVTAAQPRGAVPVFDHLLRPMLLGVAGRLHTLSGVPADDLAATWLSVVTALLCSLNGQDAGAEGAVARRLAARRFIAANLADPRLDPDAVARYLHVSRRSLYQLFADDGGVSRTIRRQRLEVRARSCSTRASATAPSLRSPLRSGCRTRSTSAACAGRCTARARVRCAPTR